MSKKIYVNCFIECTPDENFQGLYIPRNVVKEKTPGNVIYLECVCLANSSGKLKNSAISTVLQNAAIRYGKDSKGRIWELFIDGCYYHAPCIKMVNDKDFNSPLNFNFDTIDETKREMSKMMQQKWD